MAGVPAEVDATAFWWEAPDGSRVPRRVALRLLLQRPRPSRRREQPSRAPTATSSSSARHDCRAALLLMNGTDHQLPQPWLGRVVAEANTIQSDYRFVVTSLAEYLPDTAHRRVAGVAGRAALRARRTC